VVAARTGIAGCQNHIPWNLAFHVNIELLDRALFEIKVLRLNRSREG
jgi:hypothetical protein